MTDIEITADDGQRLSAYRSDPAGTPLGGVVIIQEIFGVNSHIRSVADQFAQAGYLALAPALFDRVEPGVELAYDAEGVERGRELAWNLGIDDSMRDVAAAADVLAAEVGGARHVGAVGYCYGGMLAAAASSRVPQKLAAAVAYYPSMAAQLLLADRPYTPLMVHLGELDTRVTVTDGETLAQRWPTAEFHHYLAGHGFNCEHRPDYDAASADAAWARTISFLGDHLTEED